MLGRLILQVKISKQNIGPDTNYDEYRYGLHRLVSFCDGVFAFAITLLAINIAIPEIAKDSIKQLLGKEIINLAPKFLIYALSFLIIGSFWMAHHKMFKYIKKYNDAFIFLNIVTLMFVAAVPIPTKIMGDYILYRQSLIFYAAYMAITSFLLASIRFYAYRKNFIEYDMPKIYYIVRSLITPAVFLLSIPLIFLSKYVACGWFLVYIFQEIWKKIYFIYIKKSGR
jgi:uncharacterized membrane protein